MTSQEEMEIEFKPEIPKPVYRVLAEYQATEEDWELRDLVAWLQTWSNRMIDTFDLDLSEISLCVDWLPSRRYGHFREGRNGFGLNGKIALNRRHLTNREPWEFLGTLLHELLHGWQSAHGKPGKNNYHNKQFREKARSYGLIIDTRGLTQYEPGSRFFQLLDQYGIEAPAVPPVTYVLRGNSKLKKWSCQCVPPIIVRVAVTHFYARCLWCGEVFQNSE